MLLSTWGVLYTGDAWAYMKENSVTEPSGMTEPKVTKITSAYYKRFRTRSQIEAFVED